MLISKRLWWIPFTVAAPWLLLGFARWLQQDAGGPAPAEADNSPLVVAEGVQSIVVRDPASGQVSWELSAASIVLAADARTATASGPARGVLFRDGKPWIQLNAKQVRVNQTTRDVEATGEVTARGPDGFTMQAPLARWQHQRSRLVCPQPMKATFRGMNISAPRAVYDAKSGQLECSETVKVEARHATLVAPRAKADVKQRRVSFEGGVEINVSPRAVPLVR